MPNWKKVVVSGSNAELSKLNVSTAFTASGIIYPTSDGSADQVLKLMVRVIYLFLPELEHKVLLEHKEQLVQKVKKVHKELLVLQELKVFKVYKV